MNIRYGEGKERTRERLLHKVRKVQGTAAPGEYSIPLHLKGVPATDYFVARKQDMQHLADFFASPSQSPQRQQRVFIVHGLGGIGKTQLCAEFVKTHAEWFSAVLWLDGPSKDSLLRFMADAALRLSQHAQAAMKVTAHMDVAQLSDNLRS
jgi:hypothetical protein